MPFVGFLRSDFAGRTTGTGPGITILDFEDKIEMGYNSDDALGI